MSQFLPSINAYLRVGLSAKEQRTGLLYLPGLLQEGDFFKVGKSNLASAVSTLTKSGAGPALRLNVDLGPPLAVNSNGKVANLNTDKLDGLDSSALRTRCPAGTQSLGGGCIENTVRGTDRLSDASSTCAGLGRRLPTAAELDAFRQRPNVTIGSSGSTIPDAEWTGDIEVNVGTGAIAMTDAGAYSSADKNNSQAFRCVVSPTS